MLKLEANIEQFSQALKRFKEALLEEKTDLIRDASIKRFEFTLDLSWKTLKKFLEEKKGIVCNSPKGCFREAFANGLIPYNEIWLKMVDWRNETSHIYNEEIADEIYSNLKHVRKALELLLDIFKRE